MGAKVEIYATGSSGYGSGSTPLLGAPVVTDANGVFSVAAGSYQCASSSEQIYLVATGGNVRTSEGENTASAMMTAWGSCGDLDVSTNITINEVTTVAAAWSLAPFMSSMQNVGTSSTNQAGIADAFINAGLLANVLTGVSPSASLPSNLVVESAKLYSLANVLSACVDLIRDSACSDLFASVQSNAGTPTNTIDAALSIVKNPGFNVSVLYQLGIPTYPGLSSPPHDWTMSIAMTGGGMVNPASVGIDSTGRAWVINYPGVLSAFSVQGVPVFQSGLASNGASESYGLTIDPADNLWITDGGSSTIREFTKDGVSISGAGGFEGGGLSYPIAAASDAAGNIWVVNNGNGSVTKLANNGTVLSPSTGYTGGGAFLFPVTIALDANGTPWIASQNGAATHLSTSGSVIGTVACCSIPTGIAVDGSGDVWVADHFSNAVVHISGTNGTVLSTTVKEGGLADPNNMATDGGGNVWVTNGLTGTLTEIAGAMSSVAAGTALSPATGYGLDAGMQAPYGIAIDESGNIWVTSFDDSRLVRFIGLASPIKTPLVSAPQRP